MNKINYLLCLTILANLFFSCSSDDEEITPQNSNPEVLSFDASVGVKGGVHFTASYKSNGNDIAEGGFEYSVDSLFNNKSRLITEPTSDNQLKYFLSSGIEENVEYHYRAFVKSSTDLFYGDSDSFIADGSVAPQIDSISHEYAHIADTLEIYGHYFKDENHETNVELNNRNGQIISLNDSIIKFRIPASISNVINDVRVRIDNRADVYSSFTLFAPTIETINPIVALIGDTLLIEGNHFDIANSRNKVFFGDQQSTVIESDREHIKVVVPKTIESISESILLNTQLQDVSYPTSFQLAAPEINSVSPLNATFRDEITITGNNFDYELSRNKVYFGNIEATITYADKNTLKVLVPDELESSNEAIKVVAQLQEVVYEENFQLIPPELNFIPQNVNVDQDITIEGNYFHPILNKNKVTIEDIEVNLTSGNPENINTKIPLGPFPRRKAIVKLTLLDLTVEYAIELNIIDNWIMVSDSLPFRFRRGPKNAVVVNDVAYILAREKDNYADESVYLWKFNSVDFTWKKIDTSVPDHSIFASGILETNGSEIFYYTSNSSNEFWEYSVDSNTWSKRSAFPGERRDYPAHFTIGNDIYIGIGTDMQPYTPVSYNDFYRYNTSSDTWSQISDLPFDIWGGNRRTGMASFVIDNVAYLAGGASNTGDTDAWSYKPGSDSWQQIADFPMANHESVGFQIDGLGYLTGGAPIGGSRLNKSWSYSPDTNSWEESHSIIQGRGWHFSFVIHGKAYIGGGDNYSGGSSLDNFYEYIP
ncbi:IPT/TIG domain-containing protein [Salegentibacter salegens]|uniref:N-acetylneuraminic acid mutarotase n=1 Tax=Salegentibacter salegens TaxID=143223 RepID=A0A1M7MGD3_9FLAO|nr:IPT/TIG domain-containing protein [Salegentibacter salegens]PRX48093.1 N-acetylneuraminic acid mutarotase [Salegentibacter salegens]SHM89441.1 N-acetylneuraminic acid mutarotase [Salegentibacter salegens]